MPQIGIDQLTAPYNTVFVPMVTAAGLPGTPTGPNIRLWMTTQPTYILGISVVRATGSADSGVTYQAGYSPATTASSTALTATNFGSTAVADAATEGLIDLGIETSGVTNDTKPLLLPSNSVVGVKVAGTVSAARVSGFVIRYRCPQ